MINIDRAPFPSLENHPTIGLDRQHDFFQIPGKPEVLIRAHEIVPDVAASVEESVRQRTLLGYLATKYDIHNSGFAPVYGEGAMYVLTRVIDSPNLKDLLLAQEPRALRAADTLLKKIIHYSQDLQKEGGDLALDMYAPGQYVLEDGEAVLVDVDIWVKPIQDAHDEISLFEILDCQLGVASTLAAHLRATDPSLSGSYQMTEVLQGLTPLSEKQERMVDVFSRAIQQGLTAPIMNELYSDNRVPQEFTEDDWWRL